MDNQTCSITNMSLVTACIGLLLIRLLGSCVIWFVAPESGYQVGANAEGAESMAD